jgi:hypothetical protein
MIPRTSPCTSCGAEIFFAYTPNGKRMPLNPEPIPGPVAGAYRVDGHQCYPAAPMLEAHPGPFYMNHWTTCPTRDLHRSKS